MFTPPAEIFLRKAYLNALMGKASIQCLAIILGYTKTTVYSWSRFAVPNADVITLGDKQLDPKDIKTIKEFIRENLNFVTRNYNQKTSDNAYFGLVMMKAINKDRYVKRIRVKSECNKPK